VDICAVLELLAQRDPPAGRTRTPIHLPAEYAAGAEEAWARELARAREEVARLLARAAEGPALAAALAEWAGREEGVEAAYMAFLRRYAEERRFAELYTDRATYQAVYREYANGRRAGPYWYRITRQGRRVVRRYVGRELPPSALDEPLARERERKCWEMARQWAAKLFGGGGR
jgi:hypothetical protein